MKRMMMLLALGLFMNSVGAIDARAESRGDRLGAHYANAVTTFARQNYGRESDFNNFCGLLRETVDLNYVHNTFNRSVANFGQISDPNLTLGYMAGWILWRMSFFQEQRSSNYRYEFIAGNNFVSRGEFNSQEYIEFQLRQAGNLIKIWVSRQDRASGLMAQIANIGNNRGSFLQTAPGDLTGNSFDNRTYTETTATGRARQFLATVVGPNASNGCQ